MTSSCTSGIPGSVMNQESKQQKTDTALNGHIIHIVGQHLLSSQALGNMITNMTGAECACIKSIDEMPVEQRKDYVRELFLWDCLGKDMEDFMSGLLASFCEVTDSSRVALFNIKPGLGIEDSCMSHGVRGIFYEDTSPDLFIKGIIAIYQDELWFTRDVMTRYILEERDEDVASLKVRRILTQREIEILSHVAVGCKNEEIADKLCVSPHTIKTHLYNIYKKINVTNRLQATLWAAKNL